MWPSLRPLGGVFLLLLVCCTWRGVEARVNATFFTQRLLAEYGTGEQLNATQAQELLHKVRQVNAVGGGTAGGHGGGHGGPGVVLKEVPKANCSAQDAICLSTKVGTVNSRVLPAGCTRTSLSFHLIPNMPI